MQSIIILLIALVYLDVSFAWDQANHLQFSVQWQDGGWPVFELQIV